MTARSAGAGVVTDLIDEAVREHAGEKLRFYGCGPHPMLMALARLLKARGLTAS